MGSKRETVSVLVRLPPAMKRWLEREAARNVGSQNNEIVRSLRARMDLNRAGSRGSPGAGSERWRAPRFVKHDPR